MNNNWKLALRKIYSSEKQSFWSRLQLPSISAKLSHLMLAGPCSRSLGEKRLLSSSTAPPTFPLWEWWHPVSPLSTASSITLMLVQGLQKYLGASQNFPDLGITNPTIQSTSLNSAGQSMHKPKPRPPSPCLLTSCTLPTYTHLYPAKSDPAPN